MCASSIISLPATIMALCGVTSRASFAECKTFWEGAYLFMSPNGWFYPVLLFILIIAFSYFYIQISFNPIEVANNLKKNGGLIPGIRQGRPTADFIRRVLSKVTLMGAFFLSIIAIIPIIMVPLVISPMASGVLESYWEAIGYGAFLDTTLFTSRVSQMASQFTFGGTSLLIVVGVALETQRDLEAQLSMRNYKGFLN